MMDVETVIQGREVVDNYRREHAEGRGDTKKLTEDLQALGFKSVDDFFEQNTRVIFEDFEATLSLSGECDNCVGRRRGCPDICFDNLSVVKRPRTVDKASVIGDVDIQAIRKEIRKSIKFEDLEAGMERPLFINCAIKVKVIKKPALDWFWR